MSFISNSIATKAEIKDVIKDIVSFIAIQRVNKEMIFGLEILKGYNHNSTSMSLSAEEYLNNRMSFIFWQ